MVPLSTKIKTQLKVKLAVSIKNILFKNQSKSQLVLTSTGLILGLVAVVFSLQIYTNVKHLLVENEKNTGSKYLEVSKKIGYSNTIGLASSNFSEQEVTEAIAKDFIKDAGKVTANNFKVSIEGGVGIPFYTELFLQSVPNKFIDIDTTGFNWSPNSTEVPIVVSTHFFNLYNHGFAPSQGLPALPKSALKQKSFTLNIKGDKNSAKLKCRIYGYSDRINSILVPNTFLTWANHSFMNNTKEDISMLVLEVEDAGDARLIDYLDRNDYSVNKEKINLDNTKLILRALIYLFFVLGIVIFSLSVIQILSFSKLVIAENKTNIHLFFLMAYTKKNIAKTLFSVYVRIILVSVFLSCIILFFVLSFLKSLMEGYNFEVTFINTLPLALFFALIIGTIAIIYGNIFSYLQNEKNKEN